MIIYLKVPLKPSTTLAVATLVPNTLATYSVCMKQISQFHSLKINKENVIQGLTVDYFDQKLYWKYLVLEQSWNL